MQHAEYDWCALAIMNRVFEFDPMVIDPVLNCIARNAFIGLTSCIAILISFRVRQADSSILKLLIVVAVLMTLWLVLTPSPEAQKELLEARIAREEARIAEQTRIAEEKKAQALERIRIAKKRLEQEEQEARLACQSTAKHPFNPIACLWHKCVTGPKWLWSWILSLYKVAAFVAILLAAVKMGIVTQYTLGLLAMTSLERAAWFCLGQ